MVWDFVELLPVLFCRFSPLVSYLFLHFLSLFFLCHSSSTFVPSYFSIFSNASSVVLLNFTFCFCHEIIWATSVLILLQTWTWLSLSLSFKTQNVLQINIIKYKLKLKDVLCLYCEQGMYWRKSHHFQCSIIGPYYGKNTFRSRFPWSTHLCVHFKDHFATLSQRIIIFVWNRSPTPAWPRSLQGSPCWQLRRCDAVLRGFG